MPLDPRPSPPPPVTLWALLAACQADGRTGSVTLHLHAGVLRRVEVRTEYRVGVELVPLDTTDGGGESHARRAARGRHPLTTPPERPTG